LRIENPKDWGHGVRTALREVTKEVFNKGELGGKLCTSGPGEYTPGAGIAF